MARTELTSLLRRLGVTSRAVHAPPPKNLAANFSPGSSSWKVFLKRGSKTLVTPFMMGSAHKGEPDLCDVVSALIMDASSAGMSFKDFASEFGYSNDSIKAKATWKAIETMGPKVRAFFGSELAKVEEACQDY